MAQGTQEKLFRFFRSNLASIVWNPETASPLAEFTDGQFYTESREVAEILKEKGYVQIPLDLEEPPDVFYEKGKSLKDGENAKILPKGVNEEIVLEQTKRENQQKALAKKAKEIEKSPADIALEKEEQKPKTEMPVKKAKTQKPTSVDTAEKIAKQVVSSTKRRKIKRRTK